VKGIQGHVDLNVFNGYQGQWEEFVSEYSIR
jgi:GH25 family lysozyme M1 (1,4-beta-N-acetylmuramidase)